MIYYKWYYQFPFLIGLAGVQALELSASISMIRKCQQAVISLYCIFLITFYFLVSFCFPLVVSGGQLSLKSTVLYVYFALICVWSDKLNWVITWKSFMMILSSELECNLWPKCILSQFHRVVGADNVDRQKCFDSATINPVSASRNYMFVWWDSRAKSHFHHHSLKAFIVVNFW